MLIEQGPAAAFLFLLWIILAIEARAALEAKPLQNMNWQPIPLPVIRGSIARRDTFRAPGVSPGFTVSVRTGSGILSERSGTLPRLQRLRSG
jgi:hypothetical protein